MANHISTIRQVANITETGEQIPAIGLLLTDSFEKILKFIKAKSKGEYNTAIDIISDAMQKGNHLLPEEIKFFDEKIVADDKSGREIDAVAILLDEPTKNRLDALLSISGDKSVDTYEKLITNAIFKGIDEILKKLV